MAQFCFQLPDDFEGTFAAALRVVADYLDNPANANGENLESPTPTMIAAWDDLYNRWHEARDDGKRFVGIAGLAKLNEKKGCWVSLNPRGERL